MPPQIILVALLSSTFALAQTVYVPDNQSAVGICNAIPLSPSFAAATTYVARVPAAMLGTGPNVFRDIELAPCATGTFAATNLQMGLGHVPNPVPIPFTFPTFDVAGNVTALGSFLDYTPLWNTVTQGPFSYAMTLDTWSPMGLASPAFTGFVWDGQNDVGFYLTYNTATGGGSFHRTGTEPFRLYASGSYQAGVSNGSGAAGLKMGFVSGWSPQCTGCGSLTMNLTGAPSLGSSVVTTLGGFGSGLPLIGYGFGPFCFAPYCNTCMIGHGWPVAVYATTSTLNIPTAVSYIGLQIGIQGAGLFTTGGCQASTVSLSDSYVVTITQ